jgi:ubiquinone/menaquinone biosynthesis C-methylase UbiE
MSTPQRDTSTKNTYILGAESAAEMARLMEQDHLITQGMGGLFPHELDLTDIHHILDVACGPGGWALETAFAHADVEVVGVDISEQMIAYANAQARVQGLANASFRTMNVLQPFTFSDHSFDLVNARFLVGFMPRATWSSLLRECMRILRPGGILRLTEFDEPGMTNSPAFEHWKQLTFRATQQAGMTSSPDGRHFGATPLLPRMLVDAGCQQLHHHAYVIDFSAGTDAYESMYQNCVVAFQLLQPFLIKMNITTVEEAERNYQQMLLEMREPSFCALWYYLSVWGKKPL